MRTSTLATVALTVLGLVGCNMITGADQLVVDDELGDDADGQSDGAGAGSSGDGAGLPTGGGSATGGSTGEGAGGPVEVEGDATGYTVTEVAFYQAVKSTVFSDGQAHAPTVSLVAGRPAVVRVFATSASTTGAPVTARLTVGDTVLEQTVGGAMASSDGDYDSTINFDVPAEAMQVGMDWRLELVEEGTQPGSNPGATTPLTQLALETSHAVHITLIPVRYQADGSNRMPDTSQNQIDRYRAYFMTLYPATDVTVSVGATLPWNNAIDASGNGWDTLLNAISQERTSANVPFDEYYYGIFEPDDSFNSFCSGGCVAGLGFIGEPGGEYSRAAIGLGYGGDMAAWTAVHELGHNHGRPHSPCGGVSGADPNFPHSGGSIGVWGMDIFGHQLVSPTYKDFMGYCDPSWISDYVYEEVLSFMQDTGGAASWHVPEELRDQTWERVSIGGAEADTPTWLEPLTLARPPMGEAKTVTVLGADGVKRTVQGSFFKYDHLPGGVLFVQRDPSRHISSIELSLEVGGLTKSVQLSR